MEAIQRFTLGDLNLPVKTLFTGYLLPLAWAADGGCADHDDSCMADGKPGLSVDDIIYSYHGNHDGPNASRLESKLFGSMKDNAPAKCGLLWLSGRTMTHQRANGKAKSNLRLISMRALPCQYSRVGEYLRQGGDGSDDETR